MENKNWDTGSGDMKDDTRVDIDKNSNEINKNAKSDMKNIGTAEMDSFVKKMHYPAKKQEIIDTAKRDGSSEKITSRLQTIHEKYYSSAEELTRELATMV